MTVKIGINGFGRIGRLVFRAAIETGKAEVVGINDLCDTASLAHLLKYDSTHGRFQGKVEATDDALIVNGKKIAASKEKDPAALPWAKLGAMIVVESTGRFTKKADAGKHIAAGAKKVIISAPSPDADNTIVLGVNDKTYDAAKHDVISNASCTTNCLAPVCKVLHEKFGIARGLVTTIHAYTNDQRILDFEHKDPRRARAAAVSMIPTKTGAAAAIGLVMPDLKGKMDGMSMRVPTPNVSIVDLVAEMKVDVTKEEINAALKAAADGPLKGILDYCDEPLVSIDFNHCPASSTVDALSTKVLESRMVKVLSWYDNEWGYSCRTIDLAAMMG
ncbi:type I glyceraldehyde-3-phosphate dehydrogenase [Candidatus Sumerlaeota bacterium]|nr:type I glyceraldehyde-3-phosphate dehydrogenase [Candidatus Sumerlaeota bacterium]